MPEASVAQIVRQTCSVKDHWHTPENVLELVRKLHNGPIQLDVCTDDDNPTNALKFYTPESNGLAQRWDRPWFGNIPFSCKEEWLDKARKADAPGVLLAPCAILHNKGTRRLTECATGVAFLGRVRFRPGPRLIAYRQARRVLEADEMQRGLRTAYSFKDVIPSAPPDNIIALNYGYSSLEFGKVFRTNGYSHSAFGRFSDVI